MTELLDESYDNGVESEQVRIVEIIDKRIEIYEAFIRDGYATNKASKLVLKELKEIKKAIGDIN